MRPATPRGSCRDLAPCVCGKRNHLQRRHFLASFCLCRRGRHPPRLLLQCVSSSPSAPLLNSLSLSVGWRWRTCPPSPSLSSKATRVGPWPCPGCPSRCPSSDPTVLRPYFTRNR